MTRSFSGYSPGLQVGRLCFGTEQPVFPGAAARNAVVQKFLRGIDGVFRHGPIHGPLAAQHTHQSAAWLQFNLVVADQLAGSPGVTRLNQRPQAGNPSPDIRSLERLQQIVIQVTKQVFGFLLRHHHFVSRASFCFGGPHQEPSHPRNCKYYPAVFGGRYKKRVGSKIRWKGKYNVYALTGSQPLFRSRITQRAEVIGKDSRGIHKHCGVYPE